MISTLAFVVAGLPLSQGVVADQRDLQRVTFELAAGKVEVYLPSDMVAGDTISGTVVAEPHGAGEVFKANEAVLNGIVVEVGDNAPTRRKGAASTWAIPSTAGRFLTVSLRSGAGNALASAECPLLPADVANNPGTYSCDPIANAGAPLQIRGPFDGDSSTTQARIGDLPLVVLAESPRSVVMGGAPNNTGKNQIVVSEGQRAATLPCNLVRMTLSADKTSLRVGEKATVTCTINGLEGLDASEYPVPYEIVNESPARVQFLGMSGNVYAAGLPAGAVKNGIATVRLSLVGVAPGNYLLRGVFFGVKLHDVKKVMNAEAFNAWVAGLITAYREKIKKLEADLAKNPKDKGTELNLSRKRGILNVLEGCKNTGNAELAVSKTLVDKALADDAFFAMAAELITTAADMLGYTSIPMPSVGQLLKGAKALAGAAKLVKALEAIEKAEKLAEAYEKLSDAKEKLEKVEELKKVLEDVKKALE